MNARRKQRAATIVEFAAVLVLGVPLLIMLIYIAIETTHYFAIKSAMDQGSRAAARALVLEFNNNNSNQKTSIDLATYPQLKMPNYIQNNSQFSVVWDTSAPPHFVTVTCGYNNSAGLPPFPNGPLSFLRTKFELKDSSGNPIVVQGTTTMPLQ